MAHPERFELPTPWFVAKYSIQLSYGRTRLLYFRNLAYIGMFLYHHLKKPYIKVINIHISIASDIRKYYSHIADGRAVYSFNNSVFSRY